MVKTIAMSLIASFIILVILTYDKKSKWKKEDKACENYENLDYEKLPNQKKPKWTGLLFHHEVKIDISEAEPTSEECEMEWSEKRAQIKQTVSIQNRLRKMMMRPIMICSLLTRIRTVSTSLKSKASLAKADEIRLEECLESEPKIIAINSLLTVEEDTLPCIFGFYSEDVLKKSTTYYVTRGLNNSLYVFITKPINYLKCKTKITLDDSVHKDRIMDEKEQLKRQKENLWVQNLVHVFKIHQSHYIGKIYSPSPEVYDIWDTLFNLIFLNEDSKEDEEFFHLEKKISKDQSLIESLLLKRINMLTNPKNQVEGTMIMCDKLREILFAKTLRPAIPYMSINEPLPVEIRRIKYSTDLFQNAANDQIHVRKCNLEPDLGKIVQQDMRPWLNIGMNVWLLDGIRADRFFMFVKTRNQNETYLRLVSLIHIDMIHAYF